MSMINTAINTAVAFNVGKRFAQASATSHKSGGSGSDTFFPPHQSSATSTVGHAGQMSWSAIEGMVSGNRDADSQMQMMMNNNSTANLMRSRGPSATLSSGATIRCQSGQSLSVGSDGSATCNTPRDTFMPRHHNTPNTIPSPILRAW